MCSVHKKKEWSGLQKKYFKSSQTKGRCFFFIHIRGKTSRNQQRRQVWSSKSILMKSNEALHQATQGCDEPSFKVFQNRLDKHMVVLHDPASVQYMEWNVLNYGDSFWQHMSMIFSSFLVTLKCTFKPPQWLHFFIKWLLSVILSIQCQINLENNTI